MIDSGATLSAVHTKEKVCEATNNFVTTMGVSGIPMSEPVSEKTNISIEGSHVQHSFIISDGSPINLMGRDLLCKLQATIHCTPDGLFLTIPDSKVYQAVQFI